MSKTRVTTAEGLSLSEAPSLVVQSFDDVLQNVHNLVCTHANSRISNRKHESANANLFESTDVDSIRRLAKWVPQFEDTVSSDPLLGQARRTANLSVVQILLENGVDPEICIEDGLTIYHFLIMLGEGAQEIGRLLSKFRSTASQEFYDRPCSRKYLLQPQWPLELEGSPLAFAVAAASKTGVEALLEIDADPVAPIYGSSRAGNSDCHWTPIHLAIKYHSSDILQLLLTAARRKHQGATISDESGPDFPFPFELWGDLACSAAYSTTLERYAIHSPNHPQMLLDAMNSLLLAALGQARRDGRTLIMQTTDFSDTDVVETLLQLNPGLLGKRVYDPQNRFTYDVPVIFASQIAARWELTRALNISD